jgi:tetratricopeptide (TPR) repeat protein
MEGGRLAVTQVLMRDYDQESALLEAVLEHAREAACLVTYNGASFDLPLLKSRLTMHRVRGGLDGLAHVDLLYPARRVFRLRLGGCSLTRIEEQVFGVQREDDLPGAEIPARYFEYLEKRDEHLLDDVLRHNQMDIVSLARLFFALLALMRDPVSSPHPEDVFSIGKAMEKRGQVARAETCYRACSDRRFVGDARLRLAEMYRRGRRDEEALQALEALKRGPHRSAQVYISLAKLYEHRLRLPLRALETARQGMIYCSERLGTPAFDDDSFRDLSRRVRRLTGKAEKASHDNQGQAEGKGSAP